MDSKEFLRPENHPYTENPTYTGPGCAHCGRPLGEHPQGRAGISESRAARLNQDQER
jgi:hypothetical protein